MSNHNTEHTQNRKRSREERKKMMVRIVALIMAFLMVAGAAYYAIYLMTLPISATETVDTSSLTDSGDVPVRVGLTYGDSVTVGFEITSEGGFTAGIAETDGDCGFTPLWDLAYTKVSAVTDGNLSKQDMTYSVTWNSANAAVGGYHVQVDCDRYNRSEFTSLFQQAAKSMAAYGLDVIPAYVYTGYTMRIGDFASRSDAEKWVDTVKEVFPEETVYVTGASATSVSVVHPDSDKILFEFDCGGEVELGICAREDGNGNTYMKTPAGNIYDGVFVFARHNNGTVDGVALTNIVSLEAYIAGVLPYEISNTWPVEALKAFAITVRSFTLTHKGRHESSGFDLCQNVHCQVYKGAGRINQTVLQAVTETKGKVMTYDGKIVTAYYASSMGGTTVSAKDAWGGDVPYLQAKETPWEDYMNHANAFWIVEMSPEDVAKKLRSSGYDVKGSVTDIRIIEFAENSTYIKKLRVTDSSGGVIEFNTTDSIRAALQPKIKSSNFVVGRGSVEYAETTVSSSAKETASRQAQPQQTAAVQPEPKQTKATVQSTETVVYSREQYSKDFGYTDLYNYHVLTGDGEYVSDIDFSVTLLTGDGIQDYERQDIFVLSGDTAEAFTGGYSDERETETEPETRPAEPETEPETTKPAAPDTTTSETVYKVAYAENKNNFIFVGKGWGHGVGISQYGAYDLAELGYSVEEILGAYFEGIKLVHYSAVAG